MYSSKYPLTGPSATTTHATQASADKGSSRCANVNVTLRTVVNIVDTHCAAHCVPAPRHTQKVQHTTHRHNSATYKHTAT